MSHFSQPRALARGDKVGKFDCGVDSLNSWFRTLALRNQESGASRTFITLDDEGRIAGFYSLSSFSVVKAEVGDAGAGMPDPIPATLIGRLAVHVEHRGEGLGVSLLRDAVERAVRVSLEIGSAAIIAHARDETVVGFYEQFGFARLGGDRKTLMIPMVDAVATIRSLEAGD